MNVVDSLNFESNFLVRYIYNHKCIIINDSYNTSLGQSPPHPQTRTLDRPLSTVAITNPKPVVIIPVECIS